MKPLIGITPNIIRHEPWAPLQYGQNDTYTNAVISTGGLPIILPLTDDHDTLYELYEKLDGLLLAGGEDIQSPASLRDRSETKLTQWALRDHKPILATCRGMQLLNQVRGGTLYHEIATSVPNALDHRTSEEAKDIAHVASTMSVDRKSQLYKYLRATDLGINEYHHQAIDQLGHGLRAVGWTTDGIIEAIESTDGFFVFGVQCHPESLLVERTELRWRPLFAGLTESALAYHDHSRFALGAS